MNAVRTAPLPPDSLLAKRSAPDDYTDCFVKEVAGEVSLAEYITRFYSSWAFWPERKILYAIGRGANRADIKALAEGQTDKFAAWNVVERTDLRPNGNAGGRAKENGERQARRKPDRAPGPRTCSGGGDRAPDGVRKTKNPATEAIQTDQILLRDFQGRTCSWLHTRPSGKGTTLLYFGSGVRKPDGALVSALMGFHVVYAKVLLRGVRL